ncbi:MAG: pitrilysin family protein [Proteobacteria bacterium]|nr:pitrilysin family protein [Pseudomonadota bacterium]
MIKCFRHLFRYCIAVTVFFMMSPHSGWALEYKVHKLDNDLTLLTAPSSLTPIVRMNVTFNAGSFAQTKQTDGVIHLLEHMYFKANELTPTASEFRKKTKELGMIMNGTTSSHYVDYFATFLTSFTDPVVELMAAMAKSKNIDPEELEKEKTVVIDEYNRFQNREMFASYLSSMKYLTGDLFYSATAIGSTKRKILEATPELIKKMKSQFLVPANTTIVLVGNITHKSGLEVVKKYFGDWQNPEGWQPPSVPQITNFPKKTERFNFSHPRTNNATIRLTYKGPHSKDNTKDCVIGYMLQNLVLHKGGKFYKRFIQNGKWYSGGISADWRFYLPLVALYSSVKADEVDTVLTDFYNEMKLWVQPDYFAKEHLEDVKRSYTIDTKIAHDNIESYGGFLAYMAMIVGPDYSRQLLKDVESVTLKDVREYISKYLLDKKHFISVRYNDKDAKKLNISLNGDEFYQKNILPYIEPSS